MAESGLQLAEHQGSDGKGFVGRTHEFDAVSACLQMARAERPWVVWVEGEAGSGKTSFVRRILERIPDDVRVLRVAADELATDVAFAVVDQLASLTTRAAFAASLELLRSLGAPEDAGPAMVLVEDLHWSDLASRQVLLALAHRLDRDRLVLLVTSRPETNSDGWARLRQDSERCVQLTMQPFTPDEVSALAEHLQAPLTSQAAARLHRHTGGQPLYVRTLLTELTPAQLADTQGDLPAPRSLASTTLATLARLPPEPQRLAAALAVVNRRLPLSLAALVADVPDPTAALEHLLSTGFVTWEPHLPQTPVELVHPLFRTAIYDDLSPTSRRQLHRAAASISDVASAFAHRVAAADTVDDGLADELETAAHQEGDQPPLVTRARYLVWASSLSSEHSRCEHSLLEAALILLTDRRTASAAALRPEVEACADCSLRSLVLGMMDWADGDPGGTERFLRAASSPQAVALDPGSAAYALIRLSNLYNSQFSPDAIEVAKRALDLVPVDDDLAREARVALVVATTVAYADDQGFDALYEWFSTPASEVGLHEANLLVTRGMLGLYGGQVQRPLADLRAAISLAHQGASVPQLPRAHVHLSQLLFMVGDWDDALVTAQVGLSLIADDPHVWEAAQVHGALVAVSAARGQWETATTHVVAAREAASVAGNPEAVFVTAVAEAALGRARGRPDEVAAALRPLARDHRALPALLALGCWPVLISALVVAGELDEAERELAALKAATAVRSVDLGMRTDLVQGELAAARGQPMAATERFERAVAQVGRKDPVLDRALLHHAFGRHRVGLGDRAGAASELRLAHELLEPLGAAPYLERVDADLEACGIRLNRDALRPALDLTEREQSVVVLVGRGLTNREAASRLYVSEKAVEYHLRNIYGKLGVSSRRELRGHPALAGSLA
jgi:DNA-binding CsgD family transcriptional regulator